MLRLIAMSERRSFDLKLGRAEKHLIDLEGEVAAYCERHPYEVRVGSEGKKQPNVRRLYFTEQPRDEIALILADVLYNLRCALDHIACAMVPSDARRSVAFPIFWEGVEEAGIKGENRQRTQDRERWATYTRKMPREAVAFLTAAQPPDIGPNEVPAHPLMILNRLRNADAHAKLPVVASSIVKPTVTFRTPDGIDWMNSGNFAPTDGFQNGAPITGLPDGAMDVQIQGTPHVLVRMGAADGGYPIADLRTVLFDSIAWTLDELRPYVRPL